MKVVDSGHYYLLDQLDNPIHPYLQPLVFVKRVGDGYPGNEPPAHPGTNMQEVLRALIERVKYLDNQIPCQNNIQALRSLRNALWMFETRAADRHGRLVEFLVEFKESLIETYPTCHKCGHIGCNGGCR